MVKVKKAFEGRAFLKGFTHMAQAFTLADVFLPDGRQMHGRVLAREPDLDLTAISVEATGLPAAELGDSRGMRPGEMVMSMGHHWGVEGAATAGIVIGVGEATLRRLCLDRLVGKGKGGGVG